jgi:hypothetical protein
MANGAVPIMEMVRTARKRVIRLVFTSLIDDSTPTVIADCTTGMRCPLKEPG